jgi:hypothetical protein
MNKRHLWIGGAGAGLIILGGIAGVSVKALAEGIPSPTPLYYSGTLTENSSAVTGSRTLTINLWPNAAPTLGERTVCSPTTATTTLVSGRFRMALDASCKGAINQNSNVWVEVQDGTTSLGRSPVGAVPYAVEADHAVNATNAVDGGGIDTRFQATEVRLGPKAGSAVRAHASHNQSVPGDGNNVVPSFDVVDFDLSGEFNPSTGTFSPKAAGYYEIQCHSRFEARGVVANWGIYLLVNASGNVGYFGTNSLQDGASTDHTVSQLVHLQPGDQVTCLVQQDSGSMQMLVPSSDGQQSAFEAWRLAL